MSVGLRTMGSAAKSETLRPAATYKFVIDRAPASKPIPEGVEAQAGARKRNAAIKSKRSFRLRDISANSVPLTTGQLQGCRYFAVSFGDRIEKKKNSRV